MYLCFTHVSNLKSSSGDLNGYVQAVLFIVKIVLILILTSFNSSFCVCELELIVCKIYVNVF